jgi:hypothetical protein
LIKRRRRELAAEAGYWRQNYWQLARLLDGSTRAYELERKAHRDWQAEAHRLEEELKRRDGIDPG